MKYLIFLGLIGAFMVGTNTSGLSAQAEDFSQFNCSSLKMPINASVLDELATHQQELLDVDYTKAPINNDELTTVYEYEETALKLLKYLGIPAMAGMVTALACFIVIMQD